MQKKDKSLTARVVLSPSELPDPCCGYSAEWDRNWFNPPLDAPDLPTLAIVIPSFNQARFIEQTIRNILLQNYSRLELIIIDGGSTDGTQEIIRKYEPWIDYWVSEPDRGMYDALNKGFQRSSGDIMGWSPTGDLYVSGALQIVGKALRACPDVSWVTSQWKVKINEVGEETSRYKVPGFSREAFFRGLYMPHGCASARHTIQQQSTFWRRKLWYECGGAMDATMKGAGDFELWSRFFRKAELFSLDKPIGVFRTHEGQESVAHEERMTIESRQALTRTGGLCMPPWKARLRRQFRSRAPLRWIGKALHMSWNACFLESGGSDRFSTMRKDIDA